MCVRWKDEAWLIPELSDNLLRDYEIKLEQKINERNNDGFFYRFVNNKLSCKRSL